MTSESKTALETERQTLCTNYSAIAEKQFDTVLEMCVVMQRFESDTKVTNNGGRANSGRPHAEKNLWNLELPATRREPKNLCLGWIKWEPIGAHAQAPYISNTRRNSV